MRTLILAASLLLPLVSSAMSASIVTQVGTPTQSLETCFDLSRALASGVNQAVRVTVSAYETQDNAVSFDRVQLRKKDGTLTGTNVASKTDALPKGNPVSFSFDNFGVAAKDLADINCVSVAFLDRGGKNSTGFVMVKAVDVKVTRDEGDACVIIDPVIVQTPPKPLPLVADVVNSGRIIVTNGGGGSDSFTLTVSKDGTGSGTVTGSGGGVITCGSTCSVSVAAGLPMSLTATAASGSTFIGWSGDCSGSSPACGLTMSAAKSAIATFNTSGGGSSQGPNELATKSDYCPGSCSGSWMEGAEWSNSTAANSPSSYLRATGGAFSIPTNATITGVKLIISKHGSDSTEEDSTVKLVKGGVISGNNKALPGIWSPGGHQNFTYGGAGDLWGLALTPTDVNSPSGFGAAINITGGTTGGGWIISMNMTLDYTNGGGSIYDAFVDLIHALSNRLFCLITNASSCTR